MIALRFAWAFFAAVLSVSAPARAQYESTVTPEPGSDVPEERATSDVSRRDMERRQPRSAPDALRYEPGVWVQQTAHGQGSAFIRGLTGQQTLLLFDGIRLNNGTYRQGPNQYFFTLDSRTLGLIEVQRGGSATRFGSDALGGVLAAHPIEALIPGEPGTRTGDGRLFLRGATADKESGGRVQFEAGARTRKGVGIGFLGGFGARQVGLLESAGAVENPDPSTPIGRLPLVPRFAEDGRTQLGTGFKELTADGRLVIVPNANHRITLAAYLYRQYDAPRTDQCPAPLAPFNSCLTYDQQFRHLAYAAWDAHLGRAAESLRVTLSWQEQHERRRLDEPLRFTQLIGTDTVETAGLTARARTAIFGVHPKLGLRVHYGVEQYVDYVRSSALQRYTDVNIVSPQSRGQYLDGATYVYGGAFAELELILRRITLRAGGRVGWTAAQAPGDPQSGSSPVHQAWAPVAGHAGLEWRMKPWLAALVNIDHSFRAPNLDDLTSRQQTGPGFQFENPELGPERATTFEAGMRVRARRVLADLWLFETLLHDAIVREPREPVQCPASTPQCGSSFSRFQLVNAPGLSEVRGIEAALRVELPIDLVARATLSYTWGESPRLGAPPTGIMLGDRVPLSRIPPLNGTVELWWTHKAGIGIGASLRWAAAQDRLAIADYADGRIPRYGTPGFAVLDLRAWYRLATKLKVGLTVENVLDSPYRYHGSSVNGPARGAMLTLEAGLR
jgi:iron complex outermembrane receptor protein/hemoglobin/transferrin/lactoferrin receptor protein